ncbi:MAG: hypothetical protein ACO3HV_03560, partial [Candidatus Nanopelagicales bacterium]
MLPRSVRRLMPGLSTFAVILALLATLGALDAPSAAAAPAPDVATARSDVGPTAISDDSIGTLGITKTGWNVIGLDSNRVTVGPNQFPNGVLLCNEVGAATLTGTATWNWTDPDDSAIDLDVSSPALASWEVPGGECRSVYWTITVNRATSSYFKSRGFNINVSVTGGDSATIASGQEMYVEKLVSQNRNVVYGITGPGIGGGGEALVGETYDYVVTGATAPGGYEQLEFAAVFPPNLFEVISVSQNYAANTAPTRVLTPNPQVYADGCDWNNTTRACMSTGKVGGTMSSTYRVKIKAAASGASINTLIYDFSGSSYHYNADFTGSVTSITTTQPSLTVTKEF